VLLSLAGLLVTLAFGFVFANRDASVMTLASVPRTVGSSLLGRGEDLSFYLWFFLWPVGLFLWGVSSLLTLALSRYRDYVADRGAALLTGAPEQLMAALQKISDGIAKIPAQDLREASDLNDSLSFPSTRVLPD
jgi:heat shock protein HtpX